jgi:hypothetical protein
VCVYFFSAIFACCRELEDDDDDDERETREIFPEISDKITRSEQSAESGDYE